MIETTLDLQTRDGAMETLTCHPERHGPHPAILMPRTRRASVRSCATWRGGSPASGSTSCCPTSITVPVHSVFGPGVLTMGDPERDRMRAIRTKMTIPPVMSDVAAMLAFLDTQPAVKPGALKSAWHCMSDPYALAAAARFPGRIAAAASIYGTWLVSDAEESPHLTLGQGRAELYICCAEHDELAPLPMVAELQALFEASGMAGELEIHPGVHHGFAFPQRWCFDKPRRGTPLGKAGLLYRRRLLNGRIQE